MRENMMRMISQVGKELWFLKMDRCCKDGGKMVFLMENVGIFWQMVL
jgi:hypothetical protein